MNLYTFCFRSFLLAGLIGTLSACALAPGMYAGGLELGHQVVARDPATGEHIAVPVYPMSHQAAETPKTLDNQDIPPTANYVGYQVGPGDVVSVTVWEHPELTIPQGQFRAAETSGNLIDSNGWMFYPYCGRMHVAGMSQSALRNYIEKCLSRVIKNPQVDVRVIEFNSQRVTIGGALMKPGTVVLNNLPLRLSDALEAGGGVLPSADLRYITLTREGQSYTFDFKRYTETGEQVYNPLLVGGDTLHVADKRERKVNVLGEVSRPQILGLSDEIRSLADALSAVSGLAPGTAQPNRILVMRSAGAQPAVFWLQGKDPLSMITASAFMLQPGDIVYVDQTGLSRWSRVISQLLPSFNALNVGSAASGR